jgi:hypothetical protein
MVFIGVQESEDSMQRYDVWLDTKRLKYLKQYVQQESARGVSTAIRRAIDNLLTESFLTTLPNQRQNQAANPVARNE